MEQLWPIEISVNLFLQSLGEWLKIPMQAISFLGTEEFFFLVLPGVYWSINTALGIRIGAMLVLSNSINMTIKAALHFPRPYWLDAQVKAWSTETSFGMPSGHSQNGLALWGLFAACFRKGWLTKLVILLVALIGISRMALGVHFLSDVLSGFLIGGLLLYLFLHFEKRIMIWFMRFNFGTQMLWIVLSAALMMLLPIIAISLTASRVDPPAWSALAFQSSGQPIDPLNPNGAISLAAAWFGLSTGALWLYRHAGMLIISGTVWQRLLRYICGFIGVVILLYGLGAVFPKTPDMLGYCLRFIRYGLVGLWITALAPLLFYRIGLAKPSSK